jgi:hypothetical protein
MLKLNNEKIHNLYFVTNITRYIKAKSRESSTNGTDKKTHAEF